MNEQKQYGAPLFGAESLRTIARQLSDMSIPSSPWMIAVPFMALKVIAMFWVDTLYQRSEKYRERIDRQNATQQLVHDVHQDNEVV